MSREILVQKWNEFDRKITRLSRKKVFVEMPAQPLNVEPTKIMRQEANKWFHLIQSGSKYKRCREAEKLDFSAKLFAAAAMAVWNDGCVRFPRNRGRGIKAIHLQVIDCAIEAGFFHEFKGLNAMEKQSRLIPLSKFRECFTSDAARYCAHYNDSFVELYTRRSGDEKRKLIDFDSGHPVPQEFQQKLSVINGVNSSCSITVEPEKRRFLDPRDSLVLNPIHVAKFTSDWKSHGRLYTDCFGHQNFSSRDRKTIRFDGVQSVELDFSGMHCRMLYHRIGQEFDGDPYALWGQSTTCAQRLLAKAMFNTMVNAKSRSAALKACVEASRLRTRKGRHRSGKQLERAKQLKAALPEAGLTFSSLYETLAIHHSPIAQFFGSDMGIRLMRDEAQVALDTLFYFAGRGIPALGVHDSFIVPCRYRHELEDVMRRSYYDLIGFWPLIN